MTVTAITDPLETRRKALTAAHKKIVKTIIRVIESELIDALPELQDGVKTAGAAGSFSVTLGLTKAKKNRFNGKLSARVRTPREPTLFDFHVSDDGQLELLPENWQDPDEKGDDGAE